MLWIIHKTTLKGLVLWQTSFHNVKTEGPYRYNGRQENPEIIKISFLLEALTTKLCLRTLFSGLYQSVNLLHMFVYSLTNKC